jgi:hypothetical protein
MYCTDQMSTFSAHAHSRKAFCDKSGGEEVTDEERAERRQHRRPP